MQLTLDLSELSKTRVIAILEAFYGANLAKDAPVHKIINPENEPKGVIEPDAAAIFGATPLAQAAPAIVGAAALPIAPVAQPVTLLPTPPAMPLPAAMPDATTSVPADAAPTGPAPSVDKHGLPWDARIHASSKALNADGSWRAKRGLNDDAIVRAVESELRALMAIPAPAAAIPLPAAPVAIAQPAINTVAPTTLFEFMPLVSAAMMAGKMTVDQVNAELVALGVASGVTALISRPDLIPSLWATLQAKYAL